MDQETRWITRFNEVVEFIQANRRNPSRHRIEEHNMLNWFKSNKKQIAKGDYPPDRLEKFNRLLEIADKYRRLNQYG